MPEQLLLDGGEADTFHAAVPFDGVCPVCREDVLVVEIDGVDVVAELGEVLEVFRCPVCSQVEAKSHARGRCLRCGNTGRIGEPLPEFGVRVGERGAAAYFHGSRVVGEAVHRVHLCAVGPSVSPR